ncbi:hypothetical protein S40285_04623 [Stachybotrys chlorohalonatus IBT 40285]|uniref:Tubulin-specific chaperone A n=1 Tax=Stachybotrys chlorohalonatus (strain IBT 40285) TaxID=1283841 RepID=A0A084QZR4_STAC4|nr:hypothetical protein S40285_04623 [Stachybotrys chlorohalonata IBT 40285]
MPSAASVFIQARDRVNLGEEITKATKKLDKALAAVQQQRKLVSDPAYVEKMAVATQQVKKKKPADLESEVNGFKTTIAQFRELKLEGEGGIHH